MANIIDTTYFIGDISLPVDNIAEKLNSKIKTYEPEILTRILGYDLYKKMLASQSTEPYKSLIEGKEYQVDDIWYNWRGLKNTNKESLIAYYVWFMFVQLDSSFVSGSGIKQLNSENATVMDNGYLQRSNWNKMVEWIEEMNQFIANNISDYPTYSPTLIEKIPFII